jgi:predicted ATP-grasp superfamily ATP-dependent carboligase
MRCLIVEDGHSRGSVSALRSLVAAGWRVGVASSELSFVGASRHCSWRHRIPGPDDGLERFIDAVAAAVSKVGYDIVFPGGDAELLALATGREGVPAILPFPDIAVVRRALDKLELAGAAARVGIDVPETKVATAEAIRAMTYPVLVKARLHWVPGSSGCSSRIEGVVARDPEAALKAANAVRDAGGEPIVQEFVKGGLMAYVVLLDEDGAVVAEMQQSADTIWPTAAGVFARGRTVSVDPELATRTQQLLDEIGWFGLVQVQFQAPDAGNPLIIDLNGRFFASLSLAAAAGVDFPALWADVVRGRQTPRGIRARPGVRFQWLEGDLRAALAQRGDKASALRSVIGSTPRSAHSLLRPDDPLPAVVYAGKRLRRAVSGNRRRAGA